MGHRPGVPGRSPRQEATRVKTYAPKPEHIERRWYVVDASGQVLGRVASEVAALLRGKHKPIFAPHMDTGDHVIVINADKVTLTGGKETKKVAYRHSGYPGGIRATRYDELLATRPVYAVEKAVKGMLPKNRLGRSMVRKLHVVAGADHPHGSQQPVAYTIGQPPAWQGLPQPLKSRHLTTPTTRRATATQDAATGVPATEEGAATKTTPEKTAAMKPTAAADGAKKTTAKKTTAKKTTAKKTTAKKTTAKKTTAKKTTAKKTTAKKTTAKKTATRKPAAKKSSAKKTTARGPSKED
jgi:large subunit ribosomal protein L13